MIWWVLALNDPFKGKHMDERLTKMVGMSYVACLRDKEFFDAFYTRFRESDPIVKEQFALIDMDRQKEMFSHTVRLMIDFASGDKAAANVLSVIRESHSEANLGIKPELYQLWKQVLLKSIKQNDPALDGETFKAWDTILQRGIDYLVSGHN